MNNNINVKLNPPQGIRVDLKTVYVYDPIIGDATLTIQKNGSDVGTFTANASEDKTVNIAVPTKTSDLTNDDGFITGITSSDITTALGYTPVNGSSLSTVATSGSYNDLSNKPTIPTVNNPTITFTQGGVEKGSITLNQPSDETIVLDAGGGGSLPSQTGNAGKFLTTDGTEPSWAGITIPTDQTYDSTSTNAQSGTAVAGAISGKVDLNAANLSTAGKSLISGLGMPSDRYDDLTLLASGSTYTAPANGWFYFAKVASASNQYMTMYVDNNGGTPIFATTLTQSINGGKARLFLPVKKGDVVGVSYNLGGTTNRFCFVYAVGSES